MIIIVVVLLVDLVMVANQSRDEQRTRYPQGQAHDVDEGVGPVLAQIPLGNGKIIPQHRGK